MMGDDDGSGGDYVGREEDEREVGSYGSNCNCNVAEDGRCCFLDTTISRFWSRKWSSRTARWRTNPNRA